MTPTKGEERGGRGEREGAREKWREEPGKLVSRFVSMRFLSQSSFLQFQKRVNHVLSSEAHGCFGLGSAVTVTAACLLRGSSATPILTLSSLPGSQRRSGSSRKPNRQAKDRHGETEAGETEASHCLSLRNPQSGSQETSCGDFAGRVCTQHLQKCLPCCAGEEPILRCLSGK